MKEALKGSEARKAHREGSQTLRRVPPKRQGKSLLGASSQGEVEREEGLLDPEMLKGERASASQFFKSGSW